MAKLNIRRTSDKSRSLNHMAIRYRAYPTEIQAVLFSKTIGCKRKVWNLMLEDRNTAWQKERKSIAPTPAQYKDKYPYLKEVDSLALANAQVELTTAFSNFLENPKHFGHPKFKSKRREKHSYTTNCVRNKEGNESIRVGGSAIKLPKMGYVSIEKHRDIPSEWLNVKLKSATFTQEGDGTYYISVLYEFETAPDNEAEPNIGPINVIGLDYKSDGLYCDSNGHVADMPKFFRLSQKKLEKTQRKLARKKGSKKNQKKSANWLKQQKRVNKIQQHIANQRLDHHHKLSHEIANRYDIVCIESLNMKTISNKKGHLGKSTMDNAWGLFTNLLEYKLKNRGKTLVRVDKFFPSTQLCSCCGHKQKMDRDERIYVCPDCGMILDRDYNAAINIRNEGLNVLRSAEYDQTRTTAGTVESYACGDIVRHSSDESPLSPSERICPGSRKLGVSHPE
ncbi:MAG: transposase [Anaerolineaceae bacterium]|nr:transposase [Anaerolineaceae bacterium]